jgi:biopolymer transport protein ExbD
MAARSLPSGDQADDDGIVAEINITPLTDIFLVLLIIFMVTSAAMVESGAKITLPEVDSTASQPREITITVTPTNDV